MVEPRGGDASRDREGRAVGKPRSGEASLDLE